MVTIEERKAELNMLKTRLVLDIIDYVHAKKLPELVQIESTNVYTNNGTVFVVNTVDVREGVHFDGRTAIVSATATTMESIFHILQCLVNRYGK